MSAVRRARFLLGLGLVALLTSEVAAQAGGGGGFGSGGGGGSGFGGGGDGDGIGFILYLVLRYPKVGIPVAIVALLYFVFVSRRGVDRYKSRYVGRSRQVRLANRSEVATSALQKVEPGFDAGRFLERVAAAFQKAQDAWCKQDLRPLRPFVSDGVFERFSLQIAEQREDGWRQGMTGTGITHSAITHHQSDRHFDSLTVQIEFCSRIDRRSLETDKPLPGSELPWQQFSECWTFLRRRGATMPTGSGLIEGNCPNCGVNVEMNQSARCESCESVLRSGEYDWVLVEITQSSEWQHLKATGLPGLGDYQEQDPGFSVHQLEDRASVIFWRKMAADRAGRSAPLTKVATTRYVDQYDEGLRSHDGTTRRFVTDVAVGSVQTLGLLPGEPWDRAVVQVRWDGHATRVNESGETSTSSARGIRTTLLVLVRRSGTGTDLDRSIQSSHCTGCGAPEAAGVDPACAFCGAVWNDGRSSWLLDEVAQVPGPASQALHDELQASTTVATTASDGEEATVSLSDLLHWTLGAALSDGSVDEGETEVLRSLAKRCGLTDGQLARLMETSRAGENGLTRPSNRDMGRRWLEALVHHCLEDGRLSKAERRLLEAAGAEVGYRRWDVRQLIRRENGQLFRESRRARRGR